ncbi:flagellar protein FlgN [Enterovibrio calviensis]|uniref:flagellar protein FlgN n=1 Tax=Enterovibrio calviensis TaxID=91359 RepID=UPI003735643C
MASTATQHIQRFLRTISSDIKQYNQLLPLIIAQRGLYLQFDAPALQTNIRKQLPIIEQVKCTAIERSQCLANIGVTADDAGTKKLLNALPPSIAPQARKQWMILKDLITQCQQYNAENGQTSASFHEMLNQLNQSENHTYHEQISQS